MRTKLVTGWLLMLVTAGATLALSARGVAGEATSAVEQEQGAPNQIIVVLNCSPQQGGGIRVNPYRRNLASDATATWTRVGGYQGPFTIEPVGFFPWELSNDGTSSGGTVTGTPPEDGAPTGVFFYKVKFTCNGDEVVLDPRMEVS